MRRIIVSILALAGISLLVAFFNRLGDTNAMIPSWWKWLGIGGGTSMAASLLVALPVGVWKWFARPAVNHGPARVWRELIGRVASLDGRVTDLEATVEPLESAAKIRERRSNQDQWKSSISDRMNRLERESSRLEGNLASVQAMKSALEKFEVWYAEHEETLDG